MTEKQRNLLENLIAAGKGDVFVLYNLPQAKIRSEFLADSVEDYLRSHGRKLSGEEKELVQRLSKQIQKSLPQNLSVGEAFVYTLLAINTILGLGYTFVDE